MGRCGIGARVVRVNWATVTAGIGVRSVTPIQVVGLEGFTEVADGNGFVLALKSDGTVWGWGTNNSGQLGDGTTVQRPRPVQTLGLTDVTKISVETFTARR